MRSFALAAAILGSLSFLSPIHSGAQLNEQVLCKRRTVGVDKYKKLVVPDGYDSVDTYMLNSDFRSPARDIPWSQSKVLEDPVIGERLGVLDRNYIPNASRIHTGWFRNLIVAEGIDFNPQLGVTKRYEFDVMMIPSGDHYFVLRGCDGRFPVTNDVAEALRTQPVGKDVFIKLYAEGFGGGVLNQIGPKTVKEWARIYANWDQPSFVRPSELGF